MRIISNRPGICLALAIAAMPLSGSLSAQEAQEPQAPGNSNIVVNATTMVPGPEIKGVITARNAEKLKVKAADGTTTIVAVNDTTRVKAASGLFAAKSGKLGTESLVNGLPVTVKTMKPAGGEPGELVASLVSFKNNDFKTASMIRNATDQRFAEQTAATEALRSRVGDIDKYNVKGTTNVHFDTGKTELKAEDKAQLCQTASSANATENALLLVIGYTDSVGSDDYNQELSEKRANRVINYLQQQCGWKPYRMLTPTGMAKADPAADNSTEEGKAMNRRVAVNILVSKSVDGM